MDNEVSTSSRDHPRIDDPEVIYIIHITLFLTNNIQYSIFTDTLRPNRGLDPCVGTVCIDFSEGLYIIYIYIGPSSKGLYSQSYARRGRFNNLASFYYYDKEKRFFIHLLQKKAFFYILLLRKEKRFLIFFSRRKRSSNYYYVTMRSLLI